MQIEHIRLQDGFLLTEKTAELTEHEMHVHDALEVCIVLNNKIRFKQSDEDIFGEAGDVFLYRPFEPHWTLVDDASRPAKWVMLLFSPALVNSLPEGYKLLLPFYAAQYTPLIHHQSAHASHIQLLALEAIREQQNMDPGWRTRTYLLVLEMLIFIYRSYADADTFCDDPEFAIVDLSRVIGHILGHFQYELDTNEIIAMSGLGKTRFYRQFKQLTGLSPNQFIQRLRLQRAVHWLNYSNRSITEIAYDCGFGNISYFTRSFKAQFYITPREHREQFQAKAGLP